MSKSKQNKYKNQKREIMYTDPFAQRIDAFFKGFRDQNYGICMGKIKKATLYWTEFNSFVVPQITITFFKE